MNTKDLMIGNWVYFTRNSQFPMQVVSIGDNYVYLDFEGNEGDVFEPTLEEMQPIEVTDDILINSGFKLACKVLSSELVYKHSVCHTYLGDKYIQITGDTMVGKYKCSINKSTGFPIGQFCFTYLHELQNGIRLITGKDLEVKL